MKDFRNLNIWKDSHEVALKIYSITNTKNFPKEELFGITSQIRRASLSVPTNIAEGCGRGSDSDFSRFLQIAFGSACELEYLLLFSFEISLISEGDYEKLSNSVINVKKSIASLIKKLRAIG